MSMDWDKLRIFYAVAEAGSFTKAGEKLNLSQSAVSRQISGLEDSLQITLFHRHARGLLLTEQGELLYKTVRNIYSQLTLAEGRLKEAKERPSGPLRITTTTALGTIFLTRYINECIELYPDIDVSFLLTDEDLDISLGLADVAL
ncbi:MAG: LysR family transcriptional regulator [Alphaproteobacteria bacterium]